MFESLDLSSNSKVQFHKDHQNTFGLNFGLPKHGGTCPGATTGKGGCLARINGKQKTCYMDKVTRVFPAVKPKLQRNTDMLKGKTEKELIVLFRNTVMKFLLHNKGKDQYFRLTFSGDIETEEVARAWVHVIKEWPSCTFWMYTRSYWLAPILVQAKNLSTYLSCDPKNYEMVKVVYEKHKCNNLSMAYMGVPPKDEYKYIECPDVTGKLKKDEIKGACAKCRLCFSQSDKIPLRKISFGIH